MSHPVLVPSLLHGHPDDWWGGHDWDLWWTYLTPSQQTQLLELGWGEEPEPLLGQRLTSLRGATEPVIEESAPAHPWAYPRPVVVHRATDGFLVWLEEKRAELGP